MRKILALWMLICVGILIPVSITSAHFCFLESKLFFGGESGDCCPECEQQSTCCLDVEPLPDFQPLNTLSELPVIDEHVLPFIQFHKARLDGELCYAPGVLDVWLKIASPAVNRAILGSWRL